MTLPAKKTYQKFEEEKISSEFLRNKLKLKNLDVRDAFSQRYPHAVKFFSDRGIDLGRIREHSAKVIASSALAGTLFLNSPIPIHTFPTPSEIIKNIGGLGGDVADEPTQSVLLSDLNQVLPDQVGPLSRTQEKTLEQVFRNVIGVNTRATLEGEHLNTTYGFIGAEQHLARYSGDNMMVHPKVPELDEGMAPGLGAWGYVPVDKEEWYAVVQTLYLPDWNIRQPYLANWYKFRKVLIVNTLNGNAVVADIADSGPAAWTGKQFGGSPEVMNWLGGARYKKGPVIIFFVDDPQNKVPLGPVEYNRVNVPGVALTQI